MNLIHWSVVWSPVLETAEIESSWRALSFPGSWRELEPEFNATFHTGAPAPRISLLLHHALNLPGDSTREAWLRVLDWLELETGTVRLPPDHLAIACEVVAVAEQAGERVLAEELLDRYLLPWCDTASARLNGQDACRDLVRRFRDDLGASWGEAL